MSRKKTSEKPKNVDGQKADLTFYYKEQLRQIVKALFEVTCPDYWDVDYLLNLLAFGGYVLIADSTIGVMPFKSSIMGYNYTGAPTASLVNVPTMNQFEVKLGDKGELIYLERTIYRNYFNFNKIIDIYAQKLASADCCVDVNLMNSRMAYLIGAENKAQAETIKALYDQISQGEPMVVYKTDTISKDGLTAFFGNVKNTYIAGDVLNTKRTITCEFLTRIGINNANTDKRERLITDEANSNNIEIMANTAVWKDNIERCCKKVRNTLSISDFDIQMRFDLSNLKKKGLISDDTTGLSRAVGNKDG